MNILDKIVEKTKLRVQKLDLSSLKNAAENLPECDPVFKNALIKNDDIKIIAEIKKASPSKGLICPEFYPVEIAKEYKIANVDCISILTEPYFFLGDNNYIKEVKKEVDIPILRKDFIIDEKQIYEAKIIGADCILLICAVLNENKLKRFLELADKLNLSALVEAHNEDEIKLALDSGAYIIGVNNRNLKTFEVDFNNTFKLRELVPDNIIFVSESGIKTREDIIKLKEHKVNAVLIGETFMKSENKILEIQKLRGQKI